MISKLFNRKYRYFIHYHHLKNNIEYSGMLELIRYKKIKTWEDIMGIKEQIQNELNLTDVVIGDFKEWK